MSKKIEIFETWYDILSHWFTICLSWAMAYATIHFLWLSIGTTTPDRALYFCAGVLAVILDSILLKEIKSYREEEIEALSKGCKVIMDKLSVEERAKLTTELGNIDNPTDLKKFMRRVVKQHINKKK